MTSTKRSYFEEMYEQSSDPWGFEVSPYEHRKYALTDACLPNSRYRAGFEPGCSVGVLTQILARRCDHLLATDIIPDALEQAARRVAESTHVVVENRAIPADWPSGYFDLVVLSEIAYYFDEGDLKEIVAHVIESTQVGAHVIAVHWRGETDYPLSGDQAHELMRHTRGFAPIVHHVETDFLLDLWERT